MKCCNCGYVNTDDSKYCEGCGSQLMKDNVNDFNTYVQEPAYTQQSPYVQQGYTQPPAYTQSSIYAQQIVSPKSRGTAAVLCFFFGWLGFHRFYVGKVGTGIIWLLTLGLFGLGELIDFIMIICGSFKDKYGATIK